MSKLLDPIHPGEILRAEFLEPLGISQNKLARELDVPVSRVAGLVQGDRAITADTALRLGLYFGTSPQMWLNLQTAYDLRIAERSSLPSMRAKIRPYETA